MQRFIKDTDQVGFLSTAMFAMDKNIYTRIFKLTPVMSRGGHLSP